MENINWLNPEEVKHWILEQTEEEEININGGFGCGETLVPLVMALGLLSENRKALRDQSQ